MQLDMEMNLYGSAAAEFFSMLTTADMESIRLRDQFVSGIETELDESGALVIECPELDIQQADNVSGTDGYTSYVVKKPRENCYVDHIDIGNMISCGAARHVSIHTEQKIEKNGELYKKKAMYAIRHEAVIKYAA